MPCTKITVFFSIFFPSCFLSEKKTTVNYLSLIQDFLEHLNASYSSFQRRSLQKTSQRSTVKTIFNFQEQHTIPSPKNVIILATCRFNSGSKVPQGVSAHGRTHKTWLEIEHCNINLPELTPELQLLHQL